MSKSILEVLSCLTQSDDFAKATKYCLRNDEPILKIRHHTSKAYSFCKRGHFQSQQLSITFRIDFNMYSKSEFRIVVTQSDDFAKAIGFACMMADFQNALISRIFDVFSSGFLHTTTLNHF